MGGYAIFGMLYFVADVVTSLHSYRAPLALPFERDLAFVPVMAVAYVSLYGMFLIVPFVLRTRREVLAFYWTFMAQVAIAIPCYLLLPVAPVFPPNPDPGVFRPVFELTDGINLTYNMFPSIHVAFATSTAMMLAKRDAVGALIWVWAAVVSASTVLTHQHHLADVAGGVILAVVCVRRFYVRLLADPTRLVTS